MIITCQIFQVYTRASFPLVQDVPQFGPLAATMFGQMVAVRRSELSFATQLVFAPT